MTDERMTKVHVDLPHHWATGGESMWAKDLGGGRFWLENVPFYAVRDRLDEWVTEGLAEYETCEARVPGSFDEAPGL